MFHSITESFIPDLEDLNNDGRKVIVSKYVFCGDLDSLYSHDLNQNEGTIIPFDSDESYPGLQTRYSPYIGIGEGFVTPHGSIKPNFDVADVIGRRTPNYDPSTNTYTFFGVGSTKSEKEVTAENGRCLKLVLGDEGQGFLPTTLEMGDMIEAVYHPVERVVNEKFLTDSDSGIAIPVETLQYRYLSNSWTIMTRTRIDSNSVVINPPVSKKDFQYAFPADCRYYDVRKNKMMGPPVMKPIIVPKASSTRRFLLASLILLMLILVMAFGNRRRRGIK
jgi:hypothetical protein